MLSSRRVRAGQLDRRFDHQALLEVDRDSYVLAPVLQGHAWDRIVAGLWPELSAELESVFKTKTQAQWCEIMEGTDICFAPVLTMAEAPHHPHNAARATFLTDPTCPAPAPRLSRTAGQVCAPKTVAASDVLARWEA